MGWIIVSARLGMTREEVTAPWRRAVFAVN
jgi:hypothetical protein